MTYLLIIDSRNHLPSMLNTGETPVFSSQDIPGDEPWLKASIMMCFLFLLSREWLRVDTFSRPSQDERNQHISTTEPQ